MPRVLVSDRDDVRPHEAPAIQTPFLLLHLLVKTICIETGSLTCGQRTTRAMLTARISAAMANPHCGRVNWRRKAGQQLSGHLVDRTK